MNRHTQPSSLPQRGGPSAFTLTELLVSIALVAILMLAINTIFTSISGAVGTGQMLSTAMRDQRTLAAVFKADMTGMVNNDTSPFLMIRSQRLTAFSNTQDRMADTDYNELALGAARQTQTLSFDRTGTGEFTPSAIETNARSHRADVLGFFATGQFQRQTANDNSVRIAADMTSGEAYVWYGHLWLPNNSNPPYFYTVLSPTYNVLGDDETFPGVGIEGTNPNNFYASQWSLGRMAMLLRAPTSKNSLDPIAAGAADRFIYGQNYERQVYIGHDPGALTISPFSGPSCHTVDGQVFPNTWPRVYNSRYDLAGTTVSDYRQILNNAITAGLATWWDDGYFGYRFQANPFPVRPLDTTKFAQAVPLLLNNCSQFIVEYAGDFVRQNGAGDVTGAQSVCVFNTGKYDPITVGTGDTDGEIDFVLVNGVKQIRWYGFPRNVNTTLDPAGGISVVGTGPASGMVDVVPLRDVIASCATFPALGGKLYIGATFERPYDPSGPAWLLPQVALANYGDPLNNVAMAASKYICAWGPDSVGAPRPKLIRILVKQDDPAGRLKDLPMQEYIFAVP